MCVGRIQLSYKERCAFARTARFFKGFARADRKTRFARYRYYNAISRRNRLAHSARKIKKTRCVYQVEFCIVYFQSVYGGRNRHLALLFLGIKIHNGSAVRCFSYPFGSLSVKQYRVSKRGFTRTAVTQ